MAVNAKKKETSLSQTVANSFYQAPLYPLSYVKVLAQIGHEPLPPFRSRTLFGREKFYYPNMFSYLKYIYSVEGVSGLYRGLGMKIVSNAIGTIVYENVSLMMEENEEQDQESSKGKSEENSIQIFVKQTSKEITAKCWGVIFSHPFHVMALRCMAQFVGGETRYSSWNVFQNTTEIFNNEGWGGFFSGLVPRLLFEASTIAITNTLAYMIKTYIFEDKDIDALIDTITSVFVSSVTYPLSLVSTVSSINGSSLIAGRPPRMAMYTSWMECFKHLYENNELKRGSSYFFRIYTPPMAPLKHTGFVLNQPNKVAA